MTEDREIIYLDYAATTPTDPRVVEAMLPYFTQRFGNAASRTHFYGQEASDAVKIARQQVADLIRAEKSEDIIFTSGATEAINLAIIGSFEACGRKDFHMITALTEHKAVLDTCAYIESQGAEVTYLGVDSNGLINLEQLTNSFKPNTKLVSIMFANNETGIIQPIEKIAALTHIHQAFFFTDATQALGKIEIDVRKMGIDLLACSAHKLYGPNGVGALYINRSYVNKSQLMAHIHGGGHEGGFRSGTLNTPGIVGFGAACSIAKKEMGEEATRISNITQRIVEGLSKISDFTLNTDPVDKLPNIISFRFGDIDAEAIIIQSKNSIALSNGSACTSKEIKPSHVLMAMKGDSNIAYATLRLSIGRFTTEAEVNEIIRAFEEALEELQAYQ
ncbi:cysteine desulfurase [Sphingobacterium nematocida]|uniref:cysteine desulfurase n=1 Tax=Sphingobacterium nematocida TaxID=1513896 RepID=A0A1T5B0N5_9SPHI|nr:cysteine desulfurase family protein [Sphingobacterium nematocida]SKB40774.1 cysteine desulfurase [Sphingobacterium nematocida]